MKDTTEIMDSMYAKLDNFLKTETVVGDTIVVDSVKLIPIITASFGLGGGFGEENSSGGGAGGGLGCKISPDAILVIQGDNVEMLPINSNNSLDKLIEKVPNIIAKIQEGKEQKNNEK